MLAALLIAAQPPAAGPVVQMPVIPRQEVAFVAQCRFADGTRVTLAHRFDSDNYRLIISRGQDDYRLMTFTPREGGQMQIEGGDRPDNRLEDVVSAGALFDALIRQPFRAVSAADFPAELGREEMPSCPQGLRAPD